jgi:hypothetical protein
MFIRIFAITFFICFALMCIYGCYNWSNTLYQYAKRGIKTQAEVIEVKQFGSNKPSYYAFLQFQDTQNKIYTIERRMKAKEGEKITIQYLAESPENATTESTTLMVFYAIASGLMGIFTTMGLIIFTNNPLSTIILNKIKNRRN